MPKYANIVKHFLPICNFFAYRSPDIRRSPACAKGTFAGRLNNYCIESLIFTCVSYRRRPRRPDEQCDTSRRRGRRRYMMLLKINVLLYYAHLKKYLSDGRKYGMFPQNIQANQNERRAAENFCGLTQMGNFAKDGSNASRARSPTTPRRRDDQCGLQNQDVEHR